MNELENELLKIDVFSKYNNLVPYVGKNYNQYKILIIGESHFLRKEFKDELSENIFYDKKLEKLSPELLDNLQKLSTKVECNKEKMSHRMHKNISASLKKIKPELNYDDIAYYNYFLRPAIYGKTIKENNRDKEEAQKTFAEIKNILKPNLIIFVSKKAYQNSDKKDCDFIQHPTCSWWYRKSKSNGNISGKEKFIQIVSKNINKYN